VLAVLTKGDKLGTSARRAQAGAIAAQLGLAPEQVETTSSKSGLGLAELRATAAAALAGAAEEDR
jgi:GTP-binding protein EngB required for normal cell division